MPYSTSSLTTKQGIEFMVKLKALKKDDFEKCPNIIALLTKSVFLNKPIDYSKCNTFPEINKDNNKT